MAAIPQSMKAVVFNEINGPAQVVEKPVPSIKEGELLVKMKSVTICASDYMPLKGVFGEVRGQTAGHEGVGTVAAVNGFSGGLKVGDTIGFVSISGTCKTCIACCRGNGQLCVTGDKHVRGITTDGLWAEYAVVQAEFAVAIPPGLPAERLSPLFCAGVTGFRAVKCINAPHRGVIAVFGLGGVGSFAARFARAMGFAVIGFDPSQAARDRTAGLDAVLDPTDMSAATAEVRRLTDGRMLDGVIVASLYESAYSAALELAGLSSTVVAVGIPYDKIKVDMNSVIMKGLTVVGSLMGSKADVVEMMHLVQRHNIIPDVELGSLEDMPGLLAKSVAGQVSGKVGALL